MWSESEVKGDFENKFVIVLMKKPLAIFYLVVNNFILFLYTLYVKICLKQINIGGGLFT
jgi:hypothetical protein